MAIIDMNLNNILLSVSCIYLITVKCEDTVFRIRKCCSEDELIMERTEQCSEFKLLKHFYYVNETNDEGIHVSDVGMKGSRPWWFPPQSDIISLKTKKSLKEFPKNYKIESGDGQPCEITETAYLPLYFYKYSFYEDGTIIIHPSQDNKYHGLKSKIEFEPLSYCIDRLLFLDDYGSEENIEHVLDVFENVDFMVKLCPCKKATCILKCCEPGMLFDMTDDEKPGCRKNDGDDWTPIYSKEEDTSPDYFLLHGLPQCKEGESVVIPNYPNTVNPEYIIFSNGSARIDGETYINQPVKFCGDNILTNKAEGIRNRILRCYPKQGVLKDWRYVKKLLYGWGSVIGAIFFLLTLIVHYSLPNVRKLNDKSVICQTMCLFVSHASVSVPNLVTDISDPVLCAMLGFLIQYSSLAAFFWLNVLCFDISYTFSSFRIARNGHNLLTRKKQIFYYVYGWIIPALIVLVTAAAKYIPALSKYLIKVEFNDSCWFETGTLSQAIYFYVPIAILLFINFLLFLYTTIRIMRARSEISSTIRNRSHEKKRFLLYLKLFILMGVSWISEVISWAVGGPEYYWFLPDCINLLRAVFIFVTLCCKKPVWEEFKKKFRLKKINVRRPSNTRSFILTSSQMGEQYKFSNNADSSL